MAEVLDAFTSVLGERRGSRYQDSLMLIPATPFVQAAFGDSTLPQGLVTLVSDSGGTAKSSTLFSLALEMADMGCKVSYVDCDHRLKFKNLGVNKMDIIWPEVHEGAETAKMMVAKDHGEGHVVVLDSWEMAYLGDEIVSKELLEEMAALALANKVTLVIGFNNSIRSGDANEIAVLTTTMRCPTVTSHLFVTFERYDARIGKESKENFDCMIDVASLKPSVMGEEPFHS